MKSFFNKLIGKQNESEASVDLTWLDELEKLDELSAIETSTKKLKSYFSSESISDAEKLRVLLAVDQENRFRIHKITRQFVEFQNMRPELEERITETLYFYHRQIFINYRSLSRRFFETSDDIIFTYNRLPVVLGRAMTAAYAMVKCRYFRRQNAPDMVWLDIFDIYAMLEKEALLDLTVPLYRAELDTQLAAVFVQACMLDSLAQSNLTKLQIYRVSRLLEKWIPWVKITKQYDDKKHLYYVELSKDHGAKRIRLFEPTVLCRYWDTDQLTAKIQTTIQALDQDLPHEMEDIGSSSELLEIMTILRSEWSREAYKRQRRSEDRQKVIKSATVIYGLDDICERLKRIYMAQVKTNLEVIGSLDDRLMNHSVSRSSPTILFQDLVKDRWMISDESTSGFGVVVSEELPEGVRLGRLVALMPEDQQKRFSLGAIRSIKKLPNGQHHIGIKIMSKQPEFALLNHADLRIEHSGAQAHNSQSASPTTANLLSFSAVYLPIEPGLSNWPSLVLPRVEFNENGVYQLNLRNKKSIIQLDSAIDGKDDWIRVSYPE